MASKPKPKLRRRGFADGGLYSQIPDISSKDPTTPLSSDSFGKSITGGAKQVAEAYTAYKKATAKTPGGTPEDTTDPINSARGGKIKHTAGPRIGKDDGLIPAQRGEYVVRRSAVKKLGTSALNQINKGKIPARKVR